MTHVRTSQLVRRYHPMRLLGALSGGVGVVVTLGASAPPDALAATHLIAGARAAASGGTWTVAPGGTSLSGSYFNVRDTKTGAGYSCGASMILAFKAGSGLSGRDIASVSSVSFGHCFGWTVLVPPGFDRLSSSRASSVAAFTIVSSGCSWQYLSTHATRALALMSCNTSFFPPITVHILSAER